MRCGCRTSFDELVNRYSPGLYRFLSHRTRNAHDAEDIVQDTFIRVFENIDRYRGAYKFSTWLFTIARRLASSKLRRRRISHLMAGAKSEEPGPSEVMAQKEMRKGLWETAHDMTQSRYQVLRLKYAEDMSIKEIAKIMGKSSVSVKVLLCRARVDLAKRLRDMAPQGRKTGNVSAKETLAFMKVEGA